MKCFQAILAGAAFIAISALSRADPAPTVHYAPAENLEHVYVAVIDAHAVKGIPGVRFAARLGSASLEAGENGAGFGQTLFIKSGVWRDGSRWGSPHPKRFHAIAAVPVIAKIKNFWTSAI